jgi:hypothetical protein
VDSTSVLLAKLAPVVMLARLANALKLVSLFIPPSLTAVSLVPIVPLVLNVLATNVLLALAIPPLLVLVLNVTPPPINAKRSLALAPPTTSACLATDATLLPVAVPHALCSTPLAVPTIPIAGLANIAILTTW